MLGVPYNFGEEILVMRLPLAGGAAMALGLLATVSQAAPVTLTPSQMDELTAGSVAPPAGAIVLISIETSASSRSEVEGEGTASASAAASASVTVEASASGSVEGND
jgi:hypothetical protein